jgi:polar amino acid transport system substrate-binding protein
VNYPPGLQVDPNTKKVSGIFVDVMEAVAKNLNLRIEWTTETGWGSMIEGLQSGKYDAICSPVWANSTRARQADFSTALYYSAIGAYVRKGDHRFADLSKIDDHGVKIAMIDGEMSSIIAHSDFSHATEVSLPQLSDDSTLLLDVQTKRADVTFVEPAVAEQYLAKNPGTIENITPGHPIRIFPNTIMFRIGEPKLKAMLDVAIDEQLNAGALALLFKKYNVPKDAFLPPALSYSSVN